MIREIGFFISGRNLPRMKRIIRTGTLNAELRATQQLVVDSSKIAERMRIARELHDLLGHHLTGLSLNLEVASHLTQGQTQEHIQTAQSVTKLLLEDVREVVNKHAAGSFSAGNNPGNAYPRQKGDDHSWLR